MTIDDVAGRSAPPGVGPRRADGLVGGGMGSKIGLTVVDPADPGVPGRLLAYLQPAWFSGGKTCVPQRRWGRCPVSDIP
jgi:hypothetical protein